MLEMKAFGLRPGVKHQLVVWFPPRAEDLKASREITSPISYYRAV